MKRKQQSREELFFGPLDGLLIKTDADAEIVCCTVDHQDGAAEQLQVGRHMYARRGGRLCYVRTDPS